MKCIGTHKDTYGLGCRTEQLKRKLGLGLECGCYSNFLLNTPQGQERIKRITVIVSKPRKDLEAEIKNTKDRRRLTTLLESVKKVCHEYIRLRDEGKPCISCGTQWHKDFHAGHYYKAELFSSLKFNEYNINGQCVQCNLREEGNVNKYSLNLPERIGGVLFSALTSLAEQDKKQDFKWDRERLNSIRSYYQERLKRIKKA